MVRIILSMLLFFCVSVLAAEQNQSGIIGQWMTSEKEGVFEFFEENGEYKARLVWPCGKGVLDTKNPDQSLRGRSLCRVVLIHGLYWDDEKKKWTGGKIYHAKQGKYYSCSFRIAEDKNKLFLRGYLGVEVLGQTRVWTRWVKPVEELNKQGSGNE